MRLKKSRNAAEEQLVALVTSGYEVVARIRADVAEKHEDTYQEPPDLAAYRGQFDKWIKQVLTALAEVFPTDREGHTFLYPDQPFGGVMPPHEYNSFIQRAISFVKGLDRIIQQNLGHYTDLPIELRLYVEDVDSFRRVRDVNPKAVLHALRNGRIDLREEEVQLALEQILDVSFHRHDWGGEINDLYTANVILNGARTSTAFLLKGKGCTSAELRIRNCGKNGDQLLRLFESPASFFVVQYVGPVAEAVIRDIEGKTSQLRSQGKKAWYCVLDGQDTARVLHAYGKLPSGR